jgi:iron complex outermembrane receptor protein
MSRAFFYGIFLICGILSVLQPARAQEVYEMAPVVVTAQKIEEDIQQVPGSVSVIDAEMIDTSRTTRLLDLDTLVPNMNFTERIGMFRRITMRGVGSYSRNIGFDTRVGVYLDGVYLGQSPALNLDLIDVERVEVMRGPQGAFWGQNTVAGAINIVSRTPQQQLAGSTAVEVGNAGHRRAQLYLSTPILPDRLAGSFAFSRFQRDGFYTNISNGEDLDEQNSDSFRGQLDALLSDRADFNLKFDESSSDRRALLGDPLTDTFAVGPELMAPGDYEVNFNITPHEDTDIYGISGTLHYVMDNDAQVTSITAFRNSISRCQNDLDYSIVDLFSIDYRDEYSQFSQEIDWNSGQHGPLRATGGLHYFRQDGETDRAALAGSMAAALGDPGILPGSKVWNSGEVITDSYAVFLNTTYSITPRTDVSVGFRYTYEDKKADFFLDGSQSGSFNIAVLDYTDKMSDSTFSPSFGLTYAFSDSIAGYAKVTTGYKSAGYNLDFLSNNDVAAGIPFGKETVVNYEAGLKSHFLDNRIGANLAAFYAVYDDYQVNQFIDLGGGATSISIKNAAKVVSRGGELELSMQPVPEWRIKSALSLLDAYFRSFPGGGTAGADASGNDLPYAPHFTSAQLTLYGNYFHSGKQYTTPSNVETQPLLGGGSVPYGLLQSYDLFSATLSLASANDAWEVKGWVKNITNEKYLQDTIRDFFGTIVITRGLPRTYGIELRYKF